MNDQNKKMVLVTKVSQPMDATLVQIALGSNGIDSHLDGENTVAVDPLLSNAIGGIRVMVAEEDAERANTIIDNLAHEKAEAVVIAAKTCPRCGCQNGTPIRRPILIALLVVISIGAFSLLYPWPKYACPDCGHKWK